MYVDSRQNYCAPTILLNARQGDASSPNSKAGVTSAPVIGSEVFPPKDTAPPVGAPIGDPRAPSVGDRAMYFAGWWICWVARLLRTGRSVVTERAGWVGRRLSTCINW